MTYQLTIPKCPESEMVVDGLPKTKSDKRNYFVKVMEYVQYLARQSIPFVGSNDNNGNFYQLLLLRGKDNPIILDKIKDGSSKRMYKYTHADYQRELLTLMSNQVLEKVLTNVRRNEIFSLILDEWTDISNKEQLSMCVHTVDHDLNANEYFLSFYQIPNIKRQ